MVIKPAYVDGRGSWSFSQLADRAARFGQALRTLGVRREERILLCLHDTIDWPTAFLGAVKTGVVPIPLNTLLAEDDYRFMLADSGARVLVVSEALYPKFAEPHQIRYRARARDRLRRACPWPPRFRGADRAGQPRGLHGADPTGRHLLVALYLGLDRPAQGRGARACRPAAHQRALWRAIFWA